MSGRNGSWDMSGRLGEVEAKGVKLDSVFRTRGESRSTGEPTGNPVD